MPSSSLFLGVGAVLSTLTSAVGATIYSLEDAYQGNSFAEGFSFFEGPDPTNGFVRYAFSSSR